MVTPLRVASAITRTGVGMVPDDTIAVTLPLASVVATAGLTVRPPVVVVALNLTSTPASAVVVQVDDAEGQLGRFGPAEAARALEHDRSAGQRSNR